MVREETTSIRCTMSEVSTKELIEKIESLPPERRTEVEELVNRLAAARHAPAAKRFPDELLRDIDAIREGLRREHGLLDTLPYIHEFRDTGGR
jgi:hypothetical protein